MAKEKPSAKAPEDPIVTELRQIIAGLEADKERLADVLGDTRSQVRHLEKEIAVLRNENIDLIRSLRGAESAVAFMRGRAETLEAFVPEVMVARPRFPRREAEGGSIHDWTGGGN